MEIKKVKEISDLYNEYIDLQETVSRVLRASNPTFRPVLASIGSDNLLHIVGDDDTELIITNISSRIEFGGDEIAVLSDLRVGVIWVEKIIKRLDELETLLDKL